MRCSKVEITSCKARSFQVVATSSKVCPLFGHFRIGKTKLVCCALTLFVVRCSASSVSSNLDPSTLTSPYGFNIRGAASFDYSGAYVSSGDVNGDGVVDLMVGSPHANPANNGQISFVEGISYVVFGRVATAYPDVDLLPLNTAGSEVGYAISGSGGSVAAAGDMNGDGIGDLIVSTSRGSPVVNGTSRSEAGMVYVVFGREGADSHSNIDLLSFSAGGSALGFVIKGAAYQDFTGWSMFGAGDVNGDGLADVIVGAPYATPVVNGTDRGKCGIAYVIFGRSKAANLTASYTDIDLLPLTTAGSELGFAILGATSQDVNGWSVSGAGDVNGDGLADVIVGALNAHQLFGAAYVIFGRNKSVDLAASYANVDTLPLQLAGSAVGFAVLGSPAGSSLGSTVAGAGDVNGDGISDVIIGAYYFLEVDGITYQSTGISYVIFGRNKSTSLAASYANIEVAPLLTAGSAVGYSIVSTVYLGPNGGNPLSAAGDVNGDGAGDVMVTSSFANNYAGITYVVYGRNQAKNMSASYENIYLDAIYANDTTSGFAVVGAADYDGGGHQPGRIR